MSNRESPARALQVRPMTSLQRQVHEDFRWMFENYEELERHYFGQVIAIWRKQVVAHAPSHDELLQRASAAGRSIEELAIFGFPTFCETPH